VRLSLIKSSCEIEKNSAFYKPLLFNTKTELTFNQLNHNIKPMPAEDNEDINDQQNQKVRVNVKLIASKMKSKREV